jgi:protein-tyrosine phosphatase
MQLSDLLAPEEMPRLGDLDVPTQFYTILEEPAPLAGMPYPRSGAPWQLFYEHGFRHVVNLASDDPGYNPAPLSLLFAASLEDLFHRQPPRLPAREEELLHAALEETLSVLRCGEGVIVHCMGGTGRTGTLLGAVLVRLGLPSEEAIAYLNSVNHHRAGRHWPESAWQADFLRRLV